MFRLYDDLAWLWPLWGDPAEYEAWCSVVVNLIREHASIEVRALLNMGCGGGKNAANLKRHFEVTGIDISPAMLAQARNLNPECAFLEADMRDCHLGRSFDAILVDDAISHMLSKEDLSAVFHTAYQHLNPGGVMVVSPDEIKETFVQNQTRVSQAWSPATPKELKVVFVENQYDPDPADDTYESVILYLIREEGKLRLERDFCLLGIYSLDLWRDALKKTGFDLFEETYVEDGKESIIFACLKPV